ncbi:MAG: hypothetical protein HW378_194 [Anaerolineales bacterium]|nr:hypothetical protein [Anaerolineales bacterium]
MRPFTFKKRTPAARAAAMLEGELVETLGGLGEEHPAWRALRQIVSEQRQIEMQAAFAPGLDNESLQRNCGRASALLDLEGALDELWRRAHHL